MAFIEKIVNKKKKPTYKVRIRLAGFKPINRTFDMYSEAKDWAAATEQDIKLGRLSADMQSEKHTFGEMVDRYIRDVMPNKSRKANYIKYQKAHITMAGSNSPASLASRPVKIALLDEEDRYPFSAGDEGDPSKLAIKRTTTFHNRKIGRFSTPTKKGSSRIANAFEESDKRHYHVPCPHCKEKQKLKWSNVEWELDDKGAVKHAYYVCEHCGCHLLEKDKMKMLRAGEWVAEAAFKGTAGYFINEIYSPWVSWAEMAANFLEAKKLPDTLKTFINTSLAELWDEDKEGESLDGSVVAERTEEYKAQIPKEVYLLTASVDVQDDRLEIEILGWGIDQENWSIDHRILWGDPGQKEIWNDLDDILTDSYEHESGVKLHISCSCIDSGGHHTES